MPLVDNVWFSSTLPQRVADGEAEPGALIYPLDGGTPYLVTVRSTGKAGAEAPRVAVELETFTARRLGSSLEDYSPGVRVPFTIEVNPMSACDPAASAGRRAGDLVLDGAFTGLYVRAGEAIILATVTPALPSQRPVAYRSWRILVEGRPAVVQVSFD